MKRLLDGQLVDGALRGASLVVTDRRWAAPLSAAALGFGVFAGVAIGPGTAGTLATGAQQIIELPSSGGGEGQSGGGGGEVASSERLGAAGRRRRRRLRRSDSVLGAVRSRTGRTAARASAEPAAKPAPATEGEEEEAENPKRRSLKGTVVHANPAAGSYAMAIEGGELVSVHAAEAARAGHEAERPRAAARQRHLRRGRRARRREGKAAEATFRGAVTYADPDPAAPAYTVSGRGSSLLVQVEPDPGGAAPELPAIGSYVTVTAKIEKRRRAQGPPLSRASSRSNPARPRPTSTSPASSRKSCPDTGQLLFSADDGRERIRPDARRPRGRSMPASSSPATHI